MLKVNEIGRIWDWKGVSERQNANPKLPTPDVLLPYGYLYENTEDDLISVAKKIRQTAILANCDVVIGPQLRASSKEEREQLNREWTEFRNDMLFLTLAVEHGTIDLESLPVDKHDYTGE